MTRLRSVRTNFTGGEIAPTLLARGDLRSYENGARTLRNVLIQPTGGVTRRPGTAFVAALPGPAGGGGRLVAFAFNTEQTCLLVLTDRRLAVYRRDVLESVLDTPWTASQLAQLTWTQSADVLLFCHPDVPPRRLLRQGAGQWSLAFWEFAVEEGKTRIPFYRFGNLDIRLTASGVSGRVRLTASAPLFRPEQDGTLLRIARKQVRFAAVRSPVLAEIDVLETLPGTAATADWDEPAFSVSRGWPISAGFHQDRLVIGGSRDLPNRVWLSKSGDLFNFDLGTGLDDEAIDFAILSDQVNGIRQVFSGRHLQVFTTGAEWAVTGEPLTPAGIRLDRQTRAGSPADRQVPVREVDGATLFISRTGIPRELLWTDLDRSYAANDLALAATHLVNEPVDMDYDPRRRLLLVVMRDGSVGALTLYRAEEVTAWTRLETEGQIRSLRVVGDSIYWLVERDGRLVVEVWDESLQLDSAIVGSASPATTRWSGLDHLSGRRVGLLADGGVLPDQPVAAGRLQLDRPAESLTAGLRFRHRVEPLPANLLAPEGQGRGRPLAVTFRLLDTVTLKADLGRGPVAAPLRRVVPGALTDQLMPPGLSDRRLSTLGWPADPLQPLWRIAEDAPLPFTLLSATVELKVND
jgi:hypothetical protein